MICTAFLQPKRSKYLELIGILLQSISPILLELIFSMQDFTVKHYSNYIAAAAAVGAWLKDLVNLHLFGRPLSLREVDLLRDFKVDLTGQN